MAETRWGRLGFVFFVGIVLLLYGTFMVGNLGDLFKKPIVIEVNFPTVTGLRKGDDIRVDGVLLGRVTDIALDPHGGVLVTGSLQREITIYNDGKILIESSSVLGGALVAIYRGTPGLEPAKRKGERLTGETRAGIEALAEKVARAVGNIEEPLADALRNLRDITQAIHQGKGTIGQLVATTRHGDELSATLKEAREFLVDARGEIKAVGDRVQKALDRIDTGEGPLPALLNDKAMTEKLQNVLDNAQEASAHLKEVAENANKAEGMLGKLIHDKEMAEDFKKTVADLKEASESVRKIAKRLETGPGTITKLIQDEDLYHEAKKAVKDLDKVAGRAARAMVEIAGDSRSYTDSKMTISKLGIRIHLGAPEPFEETQEDKWFYLGAAFLGLSTKGDILFEKLVEEKDDDTLIKPEIQLAYRIPWSPIEGRAAVRGGYLEGKPGGGLDLLCDWLFFGWPVQLTFEARDAYNSVNDEDIDEGIRGPLLRAFAKAPIWIEKDGWLGTLAGAIRLYGGMSRIGDKPEGFVGIGLEWPDDDIRSLVVLMGLAR